MTTTREALTEALECLRQLRAYAQGIEADMASLNIHRAYRTQPHDEELKARIDAILVVDLNLLASASEPRMADDGELTVISAETEELLAHASAAKMFAEAATLLAQASDVSGVILKDTIGSLGNAARAISRQHEEGGAEVRVNATEE